MNKQTCITIDVSQNKSYIQGFIGPNKPISKARVMRHSKQGFQFISKLIEIVKFNSKIDEQPLIIFEYTGVYHKTLEKFLIANKYNYFMVSPLRAAKMRNSEIRPQKTDSLDCLNLAKMFYNNNLGEFYNEDETYEALRTLDHYYATNMKHLIKIKVNFKETLAIVYPNYKSLFINAYSNDSFAFLKLFPHPNDVLKHPEEKIVMLLNNVWNHKIEWTKSKVHDIYLKIQNMVSGCTRNNLYPIMLLDYIQQLEYYSNMIEKIIVQMKELAVELPLYNLVHSIPGIQDILTVRFIAEIGDINRFSNPKQMTAYAGLDPMIRQSGIISGDHLQISKKGNSLLRMILFQMVSSLIKKSNADNAIRDKYKKRTQQYKILAPKVASMACANQLLRIIFYMHKTGSVYEYRS